MEQDLVKEQQRRKKYIELFVDKLYARFSFLFTDSIDVVRQKAMDKYMNSGMSIEEITEDMVKVIEKMKKNHDRQEQIRKEKHYDLNDLFDCRVSGNCLHIHVVPKDVRDDMKNAGGPTKYINDVVAPKLDDALKKVSNILNNEEKDVTVIAAISPTLRLTQNLFREKGFDVQETNDPKFTQMFDGAVVYEATIQKDKLLAKQAENKEVEQKQEIPTEVQVVNNELNSMMAEVPKVENKDVNQQEKPMQYTKVDNSSNKEAGTISLFSICLTLLAIGAFILIAMILNLLLK